MGKNSYYIDYQKRGYHLTYLTGGRTKGLGGKKRLRVKKYILSVFSVCFVAGMLVFGIAHLQALYNPPEKGLAISCAEQTEEEKAFSLEKLSRLLAALQSDGAPLPADFKGHIDEDSYTVYTTINPGFQENLERLFRRYRPLIASGVILDADTGAVVAKGNYLGEEAAHRLLPPGSLNYTTRSVFPAASLIKIIIAAAVLEKADFSVSSTLPISGRFHTLYRHQLGLARQRFRPVPVTLQEAFAKSINPYFGKLGIEYLNDEALFEIADKFLFNKPLCFDMPVDRSFMFQPETDFERAELASGFNRITTISPLHAALIAAMPLNGGKIMRPYVVQKVVCQEGKEVYTAEEKVLSQPLSPANVQNMGRLMAATVRQGTARTSFTQLLRSGNNRDAYFGGKTGSINLPGSGQRCEWFAGSFSDGEANLAFSIVFVHRELRTVKPSVVAAEFIRGYLRGRS